MKRIAPWLAQRALRLTRKSYLPTSRRHVSTTTSREDQTFTLTDGRTLGFSEYGPQDGYPLMYFHGFPSSRLEASAIDEIARRRHIRVISPDRPGFGLSTTQPNRRIIDWPSDVNGLAQYLGLSRFAILGGSGGGPYALACAHSLPHGMMSAIGLMASAPPWEAGTKDLLYFARMTRWAINTWPGGVTGLLDMLVATARWGLSTRQAKKAIDNMLEKAAPMADLEEGTMSIDERREHTIRVGFEGFAQGSRSTVYEAKLLTDNWGFKFEDVTYPRIQIWHAEKDRNAPVEMIRYMAKRLPHSHLYEVEGNHFAIGNHLESIIAELIPEVTRL